MHQSFQHAATHSKREQRGLSEETLPQKDGNPAASWITPCPVTLVSESTDGSLGLYSSQLPCSSTLPSLGPALHLICSSPWQVSHSSGVSSTIQASLSRPSCGDSPATCLTSATSLTTEGVQNHMIDTAKSRCLLGVDPGHPGPTRLHFESLLPSFVA